jgi:hypothetical protein
MVTGQVAGSVRAASMVRALASQLSTHVVSVFRPLDLWGSRLAAPTLIPLAAHDALRAADELRGLVSWVDDGNCYARGIVGAAHVDRLLGGAVNGPQDAVRAAVAVVPTSMRRTGWTFHAATAYRSAEDGGIRVIDHLLGARVGRASGIFTDAEWAAHVHQPVRKVRVQHAVDNVPTGSSPLSAPATRDTVRRLGESLVRSIERR